MATLHDAITGLIAALNTLQGAVRSDVTAGPANGPVDASGAETPWRPFMPEVVDLPYGYPRGRTRFTSDDVLVGAEAAYGRHLRHYVDACEFIAQVMGNPGDFWEWFSTISPGNMTADDPIDPLEEARDSIRALLGTYHEECQFIARVMGAESFAEWYCTIDPNLSSCIGDPIEYARAQLVAQLMPTANGKLQDALTCQRHAEAQVRDAARRIAALRGELTRIAEMAIEAPTGTAQHAQLERVAMWAADALAIDDKGAK